MPFGVTLITCLNPIKTIPTFSPTSTESLTSPDDLTPDEKYGDEKMSDQEEDEANHEDDQSSSGDESSDDSSCYGHYSSYRSSRSPPRIQTVKTNLLEDEFDRLFGVE